MGSPSHFLGNTTGALQDHRETPVFRSNPVGLDQKQLMAFSRLTFSVGRSASCLDKFPEKLSVRRLQHRSSFSHYPPTPGLHMLPVSKDDAFVSNG